MNQSAFIHSYNDAFRPKFNTKFFNRSDDDLINAIKNIVYSCERDKTFKIKVINFDIIDNYDEVNHMLWNYEDSIINKNKAKLEESESSSNNTLNKSKKSISRTKKKDNPFAYINLKDSDLKLIKITYYIEINEKKNGLVHDTITTYIAIPRIVDGFYFRLNGNIYSAMYQIVDASTYNNSAAKNAKKQSITFKSLFTAIRVYRYQNVLMDINNQPLVTSYFIINIFTKSVLIMAYFLAKFGFFGTQKFLHLEDIFVVKDLDKIEQDRFYIIPVKNCYICCPKMLFDNIQIAQSFVYTIYTIINSTNNFKYTDIFNNYIYIYFIGYNFTNKDDHIIYNKGISILDSLDSIYDRITQNDLKLDEENKSDIYRILRWMIYMFNSLRQKDNLDISTKKIRYAEYIASYYASKLFLGICRISDNAERADLDTIKKALLISPMYLINVIINTRCQLVNYKNCVNDMDSLIALKYTYKGISGIGEKSNAISSAYRSIHPSHLGRVDIDSSSNSDPGVSGTICPLAELYDGHFSKYEEPSNWLEKVNKLLDQYRASKSKKDLYVLLNDIKPNISYQIDTQFREDALATANNVFISGILPVINKSLSNSNNNTIIDLLNDGTFIYEEEN